MNIRIPLYWIIVALPLSWGVLQSVNTALPLFGAKPIVIPYLTIPIPVAPPAKPAVTPAPVVASPAGLVPESATTPAVSPATTAADAPIASPTP